MAGDEFLNRVAIVTGGSRGIGRAIALQLARGGADIAIGYGSRAEPANSLVREIEALAERRFAWPVMWQTGRRLNN